MKLVLWTVVAIELILDLNGWFSPNANANPVVLAVPIAIGTLELMATAAAVAASVGTISVAQNKDFQRAIAGDAEKIKAATTEAVNETAQGAILLYKKVLGNTQSGKHCTEKMDQTKGENCSSNIESCCEDFLKKFSNRIDKSRGGLLFRRGKQKTDCCMEWDHLHGGLEIFDKRGNHMGERGCDDPCAWTPSRGKHAEPASATHKPRSPACQP